MLVTGVSAGLGVETARALASAARDVVGAARDLAKAERATAQVRAEAEVGGRRSSWWLSISPRSRAFRPVPTR